jgi:UDP-N-acetylmuramate dehydrogenase
LHAPRATGRERPSERADLDLGRILGGLDGGLRILRIQGAHCRVSGSALHRFGDQLDVDDGGLERTPDGAEFADRTGVGGGLRRVCLWFWDAGGPIGAGMACLCGGQPRGLRLRHGAMDISNLPDVRGTLTPNRPLSELTWLRVGGPADMVFQPADLDDLREFLAALPHDIDVFPMGVGSNLIVRDGGLRAVVIRLGRGFNGIEIDGDHVTAGAAALDQHVARKAADAGLDLTFLRTIPGSIGGALCMNAGCYGTYTADHFVSAQAVLRDGSLVTLTAEQLNFQYRQTDRPEGAVIVSVTFAPPKGAAQALHTRMAEQLKKRDETQPTKDRSAGSTFRNPAGFSSTGQADDVHDFKAWKVIDDAGMRGARVGGAQMSPMHSNFLINTGGATAKDLETLGEDVRKKVYDHSGIRLQWEIMRVGDTTG